LNKEGVFIKDRYLGKASRRRIRGHLYKKKFKKLSIFATTKSAQANRRTKAKKYIKYLVAKKHPLFSSKIEKEIFKVPVFDHYRSSVRRLLAGETNFLTYNNRETKNYLLFRNKIRRKDLTGNYYKRWPRRTIKKIRKNFRKPIWVRKHSVNYFSYLPSYVFSETEKIPLHGFTSLVRKHYINDYGIVESETRDYKENPAHLPFNKWKINHFKKKYVKKKLLKKNLRIKSDFNFRIISFLEKGRN
jgi:hypothetical protein